MASVCKNMWSCHRFLLNISTVRRIKLSHTLTRCLFTEQRLKIDGFKKQQTHSRENMGHLKEGFFSRMESMADSTDLLPIFNHDLSTVLHCAETDQDLQLIQKLLTRHQEQWKDMEPPFRFGPVVMRLLYTLKKDELAMNWYNDQTLRGLFQNKSSQLILLDMLYGNGRYDDVVELFKSTKSLNHEPENLADLRIFAYTALYKLNTEEGFQYMMEDLQATLTSPVDHAIDRCKETAAVLALKQEKATNALKIVSYLKNRTVMSINIQISAYSKLDRVEDALLVLTCELKADRPSETEAKAKIFPESIEEVEKALSRNTQTELMENFKTIKQALLSGGFVANNTFEKNVLRPALALPYRFQSRSDNRGVTSSRARLASS